MCLMRLAWFSPMPPVPSGIAACSGELVAALAGEHEIDVYVDEPVARIAPGTRSAHQFVWRHRTAPYDLTVYQLGNSSHHDFLWPYLFRYPGLSVLHDAHLHHARAAALLRTKRADDYRAEFMANHPSADAAVAELVIAGFDNHLYYTWPMTRLVLQASRMTAVHAPPLAAALNAEIPGANVATIRLGHGERLSDEGVRAARLEVRAECGIPQDAVVFGVFGGLTPEKRLPQVLGAFQALIPYTPAAHLLLAGAEARHYDVAADVRRRGLEGRVTITGYLSTDRQLTTRIGACDVALNLRWPTAREMSGPWLRALAAGRPTVITDLEHLADVPSLDPRTWTLRPSGSQIRGAQRGAGSQAELGLGNPDLNGFDPESTPVSRLPTPDSRVPDPEGISPVCVAIDVMDEDHSLRLAMRRLGSDVDLRATLGAAGQRYWDREHSVNCMIDDYRRVLAAAAARPVPRVALPRHLVTDGDRLLNDLLAEVGVAASVWNTERAFGLR